MREHKIRAIGGICALLMIFLVVLGLTGNKAEAASSVNPSVYSDDYGYQTLDTNEQQAYTKILAQVLAYDQSSDNATKKTYGAGRVIYVIPGVEVTAYGLGIDSIYDVMFALISDNPELFWIDNFSYSFAQASQYVNTVNVTVLPEYAVGKARLTCKQQLQKELLSYTTVIDTLKASNCSQVDLELAIHNKLIANADYAYNSGTTTGSSETWAHTIAGIFINKKAVCEGYSKAFQLLANYAGLNAIYVVGDAGGDHAWNYIELDGKWYALDVTWDDQPSLNGGVNYDYFNFNNCFFNGYAVGLPSHTVDAVGTFGMYPVPELTTDMSYWYYVQYGLYVTDADVENGTSFIACLVHAIQEGERRGDYYIRLKGASSAVFEKIRSMYPLNKYAAVERASSDTVTYSLVGNETFISGGNQFNFMVLRENVGSKSVKYSVTGITDKTYTGKPITQKAVVKAGKKTLVQNLNYKVKYQANIKIGTAKITIQGIGKYTSLSITKNFKILPSKVTNLKITSKQKGKITISYKKVAKATGYKIMTSTKKDSGYKLLKKTSSSRLTKGNRKSRQVLYIKVAAYRTVKGKVYQSGYCRPRRVVVK